MRYNKAQNIIIKKNVVLTNKIKNEIKFKLEIHLKNILYI